MKQAFHYNKTAKNGEKPNETSVPLQQNSKEWRETEWNKRTFHYNKTAKDLPILHEGDTVRMKPFQLVEKKGERPSSTKDLTNGRTRSKRIVVHADETESTYESQMRYLQTYAKDHTNHAMIERWDTMIERRDAMIERLDAMIERQGAMIERRDAMIQRVMKRWTKAKQ